MFWHEVASRVERGLPAIRPALDIAALGLGVATFLNLADPDLLLHGVFLILAIQAFLGGLRVTLLRIALGTVAVFGYSSFASGNTLRPVELAPLELTEWPLMVAIAVLVALMADRVASVSTNYARLYRAASDRLFTAQEDERRRVALELHDGVGQTLTALALTLDATEALIGSEQAAATAQARESLRRAHELATAALDDTRDISFRLRPTRITETGLMASLAELCRSAGPTVEAHIEDGLRRKGLLLPHHEVEVYRIVQEALANALRHAHATRISVTATRDGGFLRIEIADDGRGMDPIGVRQLGLGLPGMSERAAMANGTLTIDSAPNRGTRIRVAIPIAVTSAPTIHAEPSPVIA